jgi:hypothetical protein
MKIRTFFFIANATAKAMECLSMFLHEILIFLGNASRSYCKVLSSPSLQIFLTFEGQPEKNLLGQSI